MKKTFLPLLIFIAISCFSSFFYIHPADANDTDADGIPDEIDNCPYTPNGPQGGTCTEGPAKGGPCVTIERGVLYAVRIKKIPTGMGLATPVTQIMMLMEFPI